MSNLKMNFIVDKENNKLRVEREFNAEVSLVWKAYTTPEILDQWWAPKPWKTETINMDFKEGGRWFYAMVGPNGEKHYCVMDYVKINKYISYSGFDSFADEHGTENNDLPSANWTTSFSEMGDNTLVTIETTYPSLEQLETVINMGMKEGLTMALENLDIFLELTNKSRAKTIPTPIYLNFAGNCEEAFDFYKNIFQTEYFGTLSRFKDMPPQEGQPALPDSIGNMILNVGLPILNKFILMGSDAPAEMGFQLTTGNNFYICIEPETREEADILFAKLSEGGKVEMPMQDMFWGAYYGSFRDKFNINWMISCQNK